MTSTSEMNESEIRADERRSMNEEFWANQTRINDGEVPGESQVRLSNVDEATPEQLREEIRYLDRQLRWAYRHWADSDWTMLIATRELARQRDQLKDQLRDEMNRSRLTCTCRWSRVFDDEILGGVPRLVEINRRCDAHGNKPRAKNRGLPNIREEER